MTCDYCDIFSPLIPKKDSLGIFFVVFLDQLGFPATKLNRNSDSRHPCLFLTLMTMSLNFTFKFDISYRFFFLKQQKLFFQSGSRKSKIKVCQGHTSFKGWRRDSVPYFCQFPVTLGILWLVVAICQALPPWSHGFFLFSLSNLLRVSLIRSLVIRFSTHQIIQDNLSISKSLI